MAIPQNLPLDCDSQHGQPKIKSSENVNERLLSECAFSYHPIDGAVFSAPFRLIYDFAAHFEWDALSKIEDHIKRTVAGIDTYNAWHHSVLVQSHGFYNEALHELERQGIRGPEQVYPSESCFRFDQQVLQLALPHLKNVVFSTCDGFSWKVSDCKEIDKFGGIDFYCNVLSTKKPTQ